MTARASQLLVGFGESICLSREAGRISYLMIMMGAATNFFESEMLWSRFVFVCFIGSSTQVSIVGQPAAGSACWYYTWYQATNVSLCWGKLIFLFFYLGLLSVCSCRDHLCGSFFYTQ